MRTILSILILLISFSATAQPNQNGMKRQKRMENMKNMTPEQQATLWSKKMTLELELNPSQQEQLYTLILEKASQHKMHKILNFGCIHFLFSEVARHCNLTW